MLKRALFLSIVLLSLGFIVGAIRHQQQTTSKHRSHSHQRRANGKPAKPPVTTFVSDTGGRELIVRVLDVGQGDATYIRNGRILIIIDCGPTPATYCSYLDSM